MSAKSAASQSSSDPEPRGPVMDAVRLAAWRALSSGRDVVYTDLSTRMRRQAGLPVEWYDILLLLRNTGAGWLRQAELEVQTSVGSTGLSRMLAKMESSGLVARQPAEEDRRALEVRLTELGTESLVRATPVYLRCVDQSFGRRLDDTEAADLVRILNRVRNDDGSGWEDNDQAHLVPFGETVLAVTEGAVATSDAIQVRNALEPLLLTVAVQHLTPSAAENMRAIVGRMANLLDQPEEFFRTDWQLHRTIAALCTNTSLKQIYLSLLDTIEAHFQQVVPTENLEAYLNTRLIIHIRLVDAVCSGDIERVLRVAQEHHFKSAQPLRLADVSQRPASPPAG
jgi:DNA-binding MarR family transcriptional regulator